MDKENLFDQLTQAAQSNFAELSDDNVFKNIGFDDQKPRLEWFLPPSETDLKEALNNFLNLVQGKEEFIFIGMGGSANGIKTLISLSGVDFIHVLDSLDNQAIDEVLSKIKDLDNTMVVAISKSGTTKETQLLAQTLKSVLGETREDNFLWIADPGAIAKLDDLGWQESQKITIQVDKKDGIGGRFSSPHTLVFLAPLILVLDRDVLKFSMLWEKYTTLHELLIERAYNYMLELQKLDDLNLLVEVKEEIIKGFDNWVIQLFQESLGSKNEGFFIKTLVKKEGQTIENFRKMTLGADITEQCLGFGVEGTITYTMAYMYFLQVFSALLSFAKNINFVNQPFVEVYKKELKSLEGKEITSPKDVDLDGICQSIKEKILPKHKFIDCVLYFHPEKETMDRLKAVLEKSFPDKVISVFIGSDWNHHSYQAAFGDKSTLFLIINKALYSNFSSIPKNKAAENLSTLKAISFATYKTIQEKSLYLALKF